MLVRQVVYKRVKFTTGLSYNIKSRNTRFANNFKHLPIVKPPVEIILLTPLCCACIFCFMQDFFAEEKSNANVKPYIAERGNRSQALVGLVRIILGIVLGIV